MATHTMIEARIRRINTAVRTTPHVDAAAIRDAARGRGGLVRDDIRRRAWPKMTAVDLYAVDVDDIDGFIDPDHRDTHQVEMDVHRSLHRFASGERVANKKLLQGHLRRIILAILSRNPQLYYYQGFNDVCSIVLMVLGAESAFPICERLALYHLRDFMNENLKGALSQLSLLFPLLSSFDEKLADYLKAASLEPYVAISWAITWFAHDIDCPQTVARVYDFLLSSHPLAHLYVSVALIHHRRKEVFLTPCEFSSVHGLLAKVPQNVPWEDILGRAHFLLREVPLERLSAMGAFDVGTSKAVCAYHELMSVSMDVQSPDFVLEERAERVRQRKREQLKTLMGSSSSNSAMCGDVGEFVEHRDAVGTNGSDETGDKGVWATAAVAMVASAGALAATTVLQWL